MDGGAIWLLKFEAAARLGDSNQDGTVDFFDISPFIAALTSGFYLKEADCNEDGEVNFRDISPFIGILSGQAS